MIQTIGILREPDESDNQNVRISDNLNLRFSELSDCLILYKHETHCRARESRR